MSGVKDEVERVSAAFESLSRRSQRRHRDLVLRPAGHAAVQALRRTIWRIIVGDTNFQRQGVEHDRGGVL